MSCERTLSASLLLDGELPPADTADAVAHLLACAECRTFFQRGRALDSALLLAAAEKPEAAEPAPAAVWERIGAEVGRDLRRGAATERRVRRPRPAWALPLAASLLLVLGGAIGWLARSGEPRAVDRLAQPVSPGDFATASTAGAPQAGGEMTEDRFVAIARELLAADRRYRDAMAGVLVVADSAEPREGSTAESSWREEELRQLPGDRRPDGARLY